MKEFKYIIKSENFSGKEVIIKLPADDNGFYDVYFDDGKLGYIYLSELDDITALPIWKGSNPVLNILAVELGSFIVSCDG